MGRPKKEKPNKQGLYEVKVTVGHDFDGKLIRKSFYSSISKADAKAKAEQYKIDHAVREITGELPEPDVMTFETWARKWLETYKKGTVKEHTYNFTYKSNVENYLIPFFRKAHISKIQQIDIQRYFNQVNNNGEPLAKSTLDKQKMILKSIFDAAIYNDLCYKNPVKNIKFQKVADMVKRKAYTQEQAQICENYAKLHRREDIVIMLNTGVRRGELLGLKWCDVDFEEKIIRIERAVTKVKGGIIIDKPKTETSIRTIPVSDKFLIYLKQFQKSPETFVVGGKDTPLSISTYADCFKSFMEKMSSEIGLPILSPHELRHTYGTTLREKGIDIYTIQKVMGHSDISVTAGIYVHNDIDVLRREMKLE